jgi:hypothetical protein
MRLITIAFGIALVALGLEGYTNSVGIFNVQQLHSVTSLIPAFFGGFLIFAGLMALQPSLHKHMMHMAALAGLLGAAGGLFMGGRAFMGENFGAAGRMQIVMGIICLIYLILCIRSFILARRARKAAGL